MLPTNPYDQQKIKANLMAHSPFLQNHAQFTKSAVLIPLIFGASHYTMLMTVRSMNLHNHKGEISFPGGKFDSQKDSSLEDTALRETEEEVGINRENIKIIGHLDDLATFSGFIIRPYVGLVTNFSEDRYKINYDEVSELLSIPITLFLKEKPFEERKFPQFEVPNSLLSIQYKTESNQKPYTIWGASAHIIANYLQIVYNHNVVTPQYLRPTAEEISQGKEQYFQKHPDQKKTQK